MSASHIITRGFGPGGSPGLVVTHGFGGPAVPTPMFPASFTNFCCRLGGSNMNAGTVDGSTTEPDITPLATYTAGDWDGGTIYTAPLGTDLSQAVVGRYAAHCFDGDSVPVANQYIVGRITAVNAGTRQITLGVRAPLGTSPVAGAAGRTLRIGGAWAGMSGASWFPFALVLNGIENAASNKAHLHLKNDQVYAVTVGNNLGTGSPQWVSGYAASYGDGGIAAVDGGLAGASYVLLSAGSTYQGAQLSNIEFRNNGATGNAALVNPNGGSGMTFRRCVFRGGRGQGLRVTNAASQVACHECEAYGNNLSGTADTGAFQVGTIGAALTLVNCVAHDHAGDTYGAYATTGQLTLLNCIFYRNGHGVVGALACVNCDTYNNSGVGVRVTANGQLVKNCNFIKNGSYGVLTIAGHSAQLYNNGFGTGSAANGLGMINQPVWADNVDAIVYPPGVTPWADPDAGDFRVVLPAARGTGRGRFLDSTGAYAGTVGYPDVGAAQHRP